MATRNRIQSLLEKCRRELKRLELKGIPKETLSFSLTFQKAGRITKPAEKVAVDVLSDIIRSYDKDFNPDTIKVEFYNGLNKAVGFCESDFGAGPIPIVGTVVARNSMPVDSDDSFGGFSGLGGINRSELNGFIDRKVSSTVGELRRADAESATLKEMAELKADNAAKVKTIEELEEKIAATDKIAHYSRMLGALAPVAAPFFKGTSIGTALEGLTGFGSEPDSLQGPHGEQTIADLVHEFATNLDGIAQEQLLKLFQFIETDKTLIPRLLITVENSLKTTPLPNVNL